MGKTNIDGGKNCRQRNLNNSFFFRLLKVTYGSKTVLKFNLTQTHTRTLNRAPMETNTKHIAVEWELLLNLYIFCNNAHTTHTYGNNNINTQPSPDDEVNKKCKKCVKQTKDQVLT